MKLPKPEGRQPPSGKGKQNRLTMIVEVRWICLWTRVRLPSAPLKSKRSNTVQISSIAVHKSVFGIMLDTSGYGAGQNDPDCPPTYAAIQKWIEDNHGVRVSKSSITLARDKCGAL